MGKHITALSNIQVKMRLSSVCGLCACMTSLQCLGVLLTRWPTPGQPVVQCCVWWMSQMCSIGFRSGELTGQSINSFVLQELLTHSCLMRSSIWLYTKETRANSQRGLKISSWYQIAVSGKHVEGCATLQKKATPRHYWPTAIPVILENVGIRNKWYLSC